MKKMRNKKIKIRRIRMFSVLVLSLIAMSLISSLSTDTKSDLAGAGNESTNGTFRTLMGDALFHEYALERETTKSMGEETEVPGFSETSEYMIGSVAVTVILPESDGSIDTETEDWTSTEIDNVYNKIQAGLNWWTTVEPNAFVSFVYDTLSPRVINTGYEPINHPQSDEGLWVNDIMSVLGYTTGDHLERVRKFDNDMRDQLGTDWAYTIFVIDSSNDVDGSFTDDYSAYAYVGGPFVVMTYDNGGWGISEMDSITAHETGHIFWALDEYASSGCNPTDTTGYLNADNPNCENGGTGASNIMNEASLIVLDGTRLQIGWRETDDDTVMDILDVPPKTTMDTHSPGPMDDHTPTYTGSARAVAYPNSNPWPFNSGNSVTINKIADVEYRIDGGKTVPWTSATPSDGAFDEYSEDFTLTAPNLPDGIHSIESRAKIIVNGVDIYDMTPASDILIVGSVTSGPISLVNPLSKYTYKTTFVVNVTAYDSGSGIDKVELWYSRNGTAFTLYDTDTVSPWSFNFDTSTTGNLGTYEFYSRARSLSNDYECTHSGNDTWTIVGVQEPDIPLDDDTEDDGTEDDDDDTTDDDTWGDDRNDRNTTGICTLGIVVIIMVPVIAVVVLVTILTLLMKKKNSANVAPFVQYPQHQAISMPPPPPPPPDTSILLPLPPPPPPLD